MCYGYILVVTPEFLNNSTVSVKVFLNLTGKVLTLNYNISDVNGMLMGGCCHGYISLCVYNTINRW